MIDFVFGKKSNPQAVDDLVKSLHDRNYKGTLYVGFPIFDVDDDAILTDAVLITKEHGVIVFDLTTFKYSTEETDDIIEYQDDLYRGISRKFLSERSLVKKRQLKFDLHVVSVRHDADDFDKDDIECLNFNEISEFVEQCEPLDECTYKLIHATLQKTNVLKPSRKRKKITKEKSLGFAIKSIEKEIANLDKWQKKAAIESPDKPQRIRGLAGCGKTIILAMKAAYLHSFDSEYKIAVTFQSRALYQQLENLISKFYWENSHEEVDPEHLRIMHAWGSTSDIGLYSQICIAAGITPLSYSEAKGQFGANNAFSGACSLVLKQIEGKKVTPIFDYILIDEAQDFPTEFFQLVYKFTKNPYNIVWAYDELQNLGEYSMERPEKLFGLDTEGNPNVTLKNIEGHPQQDIMLPVCYRNPPWTLSLALALGLGIRRNEGLVRMFPSPEFWNHIGYEAVRGDLEFGKSVSLRRSSDRTPDYFEKLITPDEAIIYESFDSDIKEAIWVASKIHQNITSDELDIEDILVVFPNAYTLNSDSSELIKELRKRGIEAHIAGVNTSRNMVFKEASIAITHIHRAKGNEAPMVYVMNANYCYSGIDIRKKRNTLFTAITRAKAWVRITGIGENMERLVKEIDEVKEAHFELNFTYPTQQELQSMDRIYQDSSPQQRKTLLDGFEKIKVIRRQLEEGVLSIEDIPEDMRDMFN